MKTYWVLWTYIANYSERVWKMRAESPEKAKEKVLKAFSDSFRNKGSIYVFDRAPVGTHNTKEPLNADW